MHSNTEIAARILVAVLVAGMWCHVAEMRPLAYYHQVDNGTQDGGDRRWLFESRPSLLVLDQHESSTAPQVVVAKPEVRTRTATILCLQSQVIYIYREHCWSR